MILSSIITALEFLSIYFISHKLSSKSLKPTIIDFIFLIVTVSFNTFFSVQPIISLFFSQVVCILYISLFVASNWNQGIFLAFITLLLIFAFQFTAALLMVVILPKEINISDDFSGVIGNLITLSIAIILLSFTKIKHIFNLIIQARFMYKSLLLYSYIILMLILLYFKYDLSKLYDNTFIIIFVILLLMLSNTCILYYDNEITRKNLELISYNKNLPIYESLINDIRNSQHEFSNRLQNLEQLPSTCSTYDELVNALQRYSNIYSKPLRAYPLLKINMPLLAAALYNQALRAEQEGIIVSFDVATSTINSKASETELTDYANILLQNAIEACKPEDNIYVQITSDDERTSIKIRNPIDEKLSISKLNKLFEYGFSTKHTSQKMDGLSHGLGLYFLKKQLEKHNGYISVNCIERDDKNWICFIVEI